MRPLKPDHIRLLHIEAGARSSPIRTRLDHVSKDFLPAYDALSYCWGPEDGGFPIICDGQRQLVRKNLFNALPFLRLADRERVVWIDALCINQEDKEEKTKQMPLMKIIYERASQVIIWLGTDPKADKDGFDMLKRFNLAFETNSTYQYNLEGNMRDGLLPPPESPLWTALVKLFRREWFFRVWVIQEAVSAKEVFVVCGDLSVSWQHIVQVSRACRETSLLGGYNMESPVRGTHSAAVIDLLRNGNEEANLMKLLILTRSYAATDPRDKVFALLGIASDRDSFDQADYAHTMEAKQVFYSVAERSIRQKNPFPCLSSAGLSSTRRQLQLPSWVPDWTNPNDNRVVIGDKDCFHAAGTTTRSLEICKDKKTLRIRGYAIDTISSIIPFTREVEEEGVNPALPAQYARIMLAAKRSLEACDWLMDQAFGPVMPTTGRGLAAVALQRFTGVSPLPIPVAPDREEALWRTLCCDLTPMGQRAPARYAAGFQVWRMALRVTDNNGIVQWWLGDKALYDRHHIHAREADAAIRTYCIGRNICVTGRGRLALVPHGCRVGDKISIFKGGPVPFVLRDIGNGYHQLAGECYVHGVMDGQLMTQANLGSYEQDFLIQ